MNGNKFKFIRIIFLFSLVKNLSTVKIDWRHVKPLDFMPTSYVQSTMYHHSEIINPRKQENSSGLLEKIFGHPRSLASNNNGNIVKTGYKYDNYHRQHGAMKRIFGGNVALHSTFPYQVGLLLKTLRGLNWCGGSIISEDYIITAAHCLDMTLKALVFLGSYEIKNPNESGAKRIEVPNSHFIIHAGWDPRRLVNDIGLIRLPFPVEYNDSIQPIHLPTKDYNGESFEGKTAIASGWGRFSPTSPTISYNLRYVELPIISQSTCISSFPFLLQSTNICTSGTNGKSTCTGDSGGPLVVEENGKKILIGLTSFGSVFGCDKGYPGVYTRITSYMDWISDITGINYVEKKKEQNDKQKHDSNEKIEKEDSKEQSTKDDGFGSIENDDFNSKFDEDDKKRKKRKIFVRS